MRQVPARCQRRTSTSTWATQGRGIARPFLVDTGCDYTTLSPQDAHRLFGDNYLTMDFSRRPESIEMHGIGDTPAFGLRTRAELTFLADNGDEITLDTPIVIAQPMPPTPGRQGNWLIPSLLGRDILEHFDLALSYNPPSVTLTEAAPA